MRGEAGGAGGGEVGELTGAWICGMMVAARITGSHVGRFFFCEYALEIRGLVILADIGPPL